MFSIRTAAAVKDGPNRGTVEMKLRQRYQAQMSINLWDRILMPGFLDRHVHIQGAPRRSLFPTTKSIDELQKLVRAKAQALGPGEWVTGPELGVLVSTVLAL
jgi:predicted amidohydrolase YtcJ